MQVVHSTWVEPSPETPPFLFLWVEEREALVAASIGAHVEQGPLRAGRGAGPHPFALDADAAREAVATLLELPSAAALPTGSATLHLPAVEGVPLPSPELARPRWLEGGQVEVTPWAVEGCVLRPSEAALLLAWLTPTPPDGMRCGAELACWSAASRWAISLLLGQRVVPDLRVLATGMAAAPDDERRRRVEADGVARVRWVPVVEGPLEEERLERLAAALPCSAFCHAREVPPPREIVLAFVGAVVDDLVRFWAGRVFVDEAPAPGAVGAWPEAAQAWVRALSCGEERVTGTLSELSRLESDLRRWRGVTAAGEAMDGFRTGFRLEPPSGAYEDASTLGEQVQALREADEEWRVHIFLQAAQDPGFRVPASQVWEAGRAGISHGEHSLPRPQEKLLQDLGRALRVFPALEGTLRQSQPSCCVLGRAEAGRFVCQAAWLLQEMGFVVEMPGWARQRAVEPRLRLSVSEAQGVEAAPVAPRWENQGGAPTAGTGWEEAGDDGNGKPLFGLQTLLRYEWQVALGDDAMDPREFRALADSKLALIRMRDQWQVVDSEMVRAAVDVWQARDGRPLTLGQALQLAADADAAMEQVPPLELDLKGELACLLDISRIPLAAPPRQLLATLRPYQHQGFSWLAFLTRRGLGALLADDMGLGKTMQVISLLLHDQESGEAMLPTLLVCPTSLVGNWRRELARFAPGLRVRVHHGAGRGSDADLEGAAGRSDVVITTYGIVARDDTLRSLSWRGVVLDEAQNVKNADSRQSRAIRELRGEYRVAMTGTPVENRLTDIWSIMDFLNPGLLGTPEVFRRRFGVPIERYGDEQRRARLRMAVQPFLLRRLKSDPRIISDLPEKREMKVYCSLSREQASLYEATVREMLERIESSDGIGRRGLVLSAMTRLKQICNHPVHYLDDGSPLDGRSGKLARLEEMLESVLAGGERALVFTQFREWALALSARLQEKLGVEVPCLHGGNSREERDRMVARFQEEDGPPIFVLSLKAGGVGLTLTRSTNIFHFDRWWNPAIENQATDRAYRIGQRRDVQVYKFVCLGTLEEAIDRLLESKVGLAESVVGSGESWITEMGNQELREMLTLRDECMEDED